MPPSHGLRLPGDYIIKSDWQLLGPHSWPFFEGDSIRIHADRSGVPILLIAEDRDTWLTGALFGFCESS
jgi:hypothetical protein